MLNLTQNANTHTFLEGEKSKTKVIILKDEAPVISNTISNPAELEKSEESTWDAQKYEITSQNRFLVNCWEGNRGVYKIIMA